MGVMIMAEHEFSIGLSSDWLTPKFIFDRLGLTFDLDPAHPGWGNPYVAVPTRQIYTVDDDGLRQPWRGTLWLNPPFGGRRGQVPWLRKLFEHADGIALVAARTSADWFHAVVVPNAHTLFPNGKTKFVRPSDGSVGKEPGTGVVLIGMGEIANTALKRSELGFFVRVRDAPPYDAADDFAKSLEEGYRAIRERVAAGGPGWTPK
jgi:DNA N-6-adenine-methyltransferase (Dam)